MYYVKQIAYPFRYNTMVFMKSVLCYHETNYLSYYKKYVLEVSSYNKEHVLFVSQNYIVRGSQINGQFALLVEHVLSLQRRGPL